MLQIDIKRKSYGSNALFRDINIQIEKAGLYGFVGKNGSGKTTFFKCLSHLVDFQGKIIYNNEVLSPEKVAFIPTEPYLYEHLSVKEFYKFYALLMNISVCKNPIFEVDDSLLIKELSTGMRKKVYINAVFQNSHQIYIFDEPFNGLDLETTYVLSKFAAKLSENHIVMMSSHILESLYHCHSIYAIKNGLFHKMFPENYKNIENFLFENP